MDNTINNFTEPSVSSYNTSSSSGFFSNISTTTWIIIILILAFLGFNIFAYLAQGTQTIADIFGPLFMKVFGTAVAVTGDVVDVSAEGAKVVVGETANVLESGLTAIQEITPNTGNTGLTNVLPNKGNSGLKDIIPNTAPSNIKGQSLNQQQQQQQENQSPLTRALNTPQTNQQYDYQANEASSSVHSAGKAGWCYVGNDKGFRSCAQVGVNDTCMSGDIFPTQEICMNPNLRA